MTQSRAMLAALAAFTGWVLVDAAIKWSSEATLSPWAIMAILGCVGAASTLAMAAARGQTRSLRPVNWRGQIFICVCSLLINYGNVIALKHVPLTLYYILVLAAPLVVAIIVSVCGHEKLTRAKIACLVAGFAGVVVALAPRQASGIAPEGEWIGYIAAFIATTSFAAYSVTIRRVSTTDSASSIQFCNAVAVGTAGSIGCADAAWPPMGAMIVLGAAAILNILSNLIYNRALSQTDATNVAQLHYSQIVTGAIVGYLVWHEQLTRSLIAGSMLIVASGLVVAAQARRLGRKI
jgi:drug/metabolite transporter (DMT)-like permease